VKTNFGNGEPPSSNKLALLELAKGFKQMFQTDLGREQTETDIKGGPLGGIVLIKSRPACARLLALKIRYI
jgi:hypothetical protein